MITLGAHHALLLDFDGSLVDIAPTPDSIHVPADLLLDLQRLHHLLGGACACISGRSLHDVQHHLGSSPVVLIGSHGAEFGSTAPACSVWQAQAARCEAALRDWPLSRVERKPQGLALHWRLAPQAEPFIRALAQRILQDFPSHRAQHGKAVLELVPTHVDKGQALLRLMQSPPFAGKTPIYIGDDCTDLAALQAAQALGGHGLAVGNLLAAHAQACFDSPQHVRQWLHQQVQTLATTALSSK